MADKCASCEYAITLIMQIQQQLPLMVAYGMWEMGVISTHLFMHIPSLSIPCYCCPENELCPCFDRLRLRCPCSWQALLLVWRAGIVWAERHQGVCIACPVSVSNFFSTSCWFALLFNTNYHSVTLFHTTKVKAGRTAASTMESSR